MALSRRLESIRWIIRVSPIRRVLVRHVAAQGHPFILSRGLKQFTGLLDQAGQIDLLTGEFIHAGFGF